MTIFFLILIILCAVILGFLVLVQNPKGGGLQGNVAGFGNQFMGVKQTTDVLEKGTWIFSGLIAVLCLASTLFFSSPKTNRALEKATSTAPATQRTAPVSTPPATPPAKTP
jgi:preprotein translocase subunit SecG